MKRKYYFILLGIILVTTTLYILLGKGGMDPQVVVDAYEKEWGVEVPAPTTEKTVFASEVNEEERGQWFTIYSYDAAPKIKSESNLEIVTSDNIKQYKEKAETFERDTIGAYSTEKQSEMTPIFQENRVTIEEGDHAFYKEKNNGKDYFLIILHGKDLYTYTWHH